MLGTEVEEREQLILDLRQRLNCLGIAGSMLFREECDL